MADDALVLPLRECHAPRLVGGKALNLAHLVTGGFPVPDGFVVTTAAFREARAAGDPQAMPAEIAQAIADAYRRLGSPPVAVRSSATAEDLAAASMAGQYETFLDVRGEAGVLEAVGRCWASLQTPRVRSYLAQRDIDPAGVAMAVVVQRLVPAEVAGVLFTANPRTGSREEMLVEAAWGLGQSVVSGGVQPDTLVLDRATGAVKTCTIADKTVWHPPGGGGPQPVPAERRRAACLNARQVRDLWRLGLRAMEHFGAAQDIEWAVAGGALHLLQSRAITTLEDAEAYEECLRSVREQLREWKRRGRGDWVRHNLAETLPHPTPLTWSVIRRFMSGGGGFGAMYRRVGFAPSETVAREGFLDLVGGRVYMDLARGPEMFFEKFPFRYDVDLLRRNPDAAQGPPTVPAGPVLAQYRMGRRAAAIQERLEALAADYDRRLDGEVIPAFVAWVRSEKAQDLGRLTTAEWTALWRRREARVMDDFAPQSLMPSLIGAMALERLRAFLEEHFWDEDPQELVNVLAVAAAPDQTILSNQALFELAGGAGSLDAWLAAYGHRAPDEFDLATPRWRERPEAVRAMASHLAGGPSPRAMHEARARAAESRAAQLAGRLSPGPRHDFRRHLDLARRYMRFREDGKHYLMLGYDLLRDLALEAGRRLEIGEEVFLLTWEELHDALATGFAPLHLLERRRMTRAAEARLVLPDLITEAEIETLGEPPRLAGADHWPAFALSAGTCTGPARIVCTPQDAGDLGRGYVLVCPSTDPSWTPLFVNAAGLVMERGGTLSHGAVVAREMGIPAVVLPNATRRFRDGESLSIDGHRGAVARAEALAAPAPPVAVDPDDTRIARDLVPPVRGTWERRGGRVRNVFLAVWAVYLLGVFLLPQEYVYRPSLAALDVVLWPVVVGLGKPGAVAVLAVALAVLTMFGQRFLTDNRRLRVAKQRADRLRREAVSLPPDSPRRKALLALAGPVQMRIVAAAFVPLAIILGPMVLSFVWLPERVDPASWNAKPGSTVYVAATVNGEYLKPVTLACGEGLALGEATPAAQAIRPIRPTLTELLKSWQPPSDLSTVPWELRAAATQTRETMLADLGEYLKGKMPDQDLVWVVRTPEGRAGRFTVTLAPQEAAPLAVHLVLGDEFPPEFREDPGDGKGPVQVVRPGDDASPVRLVKVRYVEAKTEGGGVFWAPLARLEASGWAAGWLVVYLAVYLPAMFLCRWVLGIV